MCVCVFVYTVVLNVVRKYAPWTEEISICGVAAAVVAAAGRSGRGSNQERRRDERTKT